MFCKNKDYVEPNPFVARGVMIAMVIAVSISLFWVNSNQALEAEQVQTPFYTRGPAYKFNIYFDDLGVLNYYGYRPGRKEFLTAVALNGGYFQYQLGTKETLIPQSYYHLQNNTELDNRIRNIMRSNNLTCCETVYANKYGGFTYLVNYSFDNYKTFGFVTMDSTTLGGRK